MHGHKHCGCNHSLAYCGVCDVVYCTKCGREWGNRYWNTTWNTAWAVTTDNTNSGFHCHGG